MKKNKKDKHKRNLVLDWLLYALVRVIFFIMYLSPVERNLRFAKFLGGLMWKHYHRGRQRAIDNLKASFPGKDISWIEDVGRRSFEQIVMLLVDVLFTPRLVDMERWQEWFQFDRVEHIKWLMKEEKGLLLITGHYGNFEILGYLMSLYGMKIYSIARPLDNPFVNRYLMSVRESKGQKIIYKKGAAEEMTGLAAEGATLCFIADQDAGKKGVFVNFFGRKASTYKSIGLLAMQYNIPIAVGCCRRVADRFFFEVETNRIILPAEWADKQDPLRWITQEYTAALEEFIRKDPTQYWWAHRRWKTRPKEERGIPEKGD